MLLAWKNCVRGSGEYKCGRGLPRSVIPRIKIVLEIENGKVSRRAPVVIFAPWPSIKYTSRSEGSIYSLIIHTMCVYILPPSPVRAALARYGHELYSLRFHR